MINSFASGDALSHIGMVHGMFNGTTNNVLECPEIGGLNTRQSAVIILAGYVARHALPLLTEDGGSSPAVAPLFIMASC